ncbi:MAG: MFS transporter [Galbitalea sp.]
MNSVEAPAGTAGLTSSPAPRPVAVGGLTLVMAALLLSQFVGNMNSTIITTALPTVIDNLHGTTVEYGWVMTATILGLTASTPIWSRLADVRSPKLLMQIGIGVFVLGAAGAGIAQTPIMLIAARALTGIGLGGMMALVQVILALLVPPRSRSRYMAWLSAVQLVATLGGPFIGGVLVSTPGLGWRWCFLAGVPIAVAAAIVLQVTLKLKPRGGSAQIDYLGAVLIAGGVSLLLAWASLVQGTFSFASWTSLWMGGGGILVLAGAVVAELRAVKPIVPLRLFAQRVPLLSIIASLSVGCTMFGGSIFLSQYFQYGRGLAPTESGLMLVTMAAGTVASSFSAGAIIARTGHLRATLVVGMALLVGNTAALSQVQPDTPIPLVALLLLFDGIGMGATAQYLVLGVQNTVGVADVGAASGGVTFFRSLGGSLTLAALGGFLATRLAHYQSMGATVAHSYLVAVPQVFVVTFCMTIPGLVAVAFLPRIKLRETIDLASTVPEAEGISASSGL